MVVKVEENKRNRFKFEKSFLLTSVLVIVLSVGLSFYLINFERCEKIDQNSPIKYWPVVINEWNRNGNLRTMKRVFDRLGYQMVNGSETSWDILWGLEFPYDHYPEKLENLQPHQRINHIPGLIRSSSGLI